MRQKTTRPPQLNVEIPAELNRELEIHCVFSKKTKKEIVTGLLVDYLKKHDAQGEAQ